MTGLSLRQTAKEILAKNQQQQQQQAPSAAIHPPPTTITSKLEKRRLFSILNGNWLSVFWATRAYISFIRLLKVSSNSCSHTTNKTWKSEIIPTIASVICTMCVCVCVVYNFPTVADKRERFYSPDLQRALQWIRQYYELMKLPLFLVYAWCFG